MRWWFWQKPVALTCPECDKAAGFVPTAQVMDAFLVGGKPSLNQRAFDVICRGCGAPLELSAAGFKALRKKPQTQNNHPPPPNDDDEDRRPDSDLRVTRAEERRIKRALERRS